MNRELANRFYRSKDKMSFIFNLEDSDKEKLVALSDWAISALEYTIKERIRKITPLYGEIWTVNLGENVGSEMSTEKLKSRPCIVVSYDAFNSNSNLATIIPITNANCNFKTQFEIKDIFLEDIESTISGTVKAEQITTKSKGRFDRRIGKLNEKGIYLLKCIMLNHQGMDDITSLIKPPSNFEDGMKYLGSQLSLNLNNDNSYDDE